MFTLIKENLEILTKMFYQKTNKEFKRVTEWG